MNTKLINFARIARKYFSEDNPQPTQNSGESKPLNQIIETDPNKWLVPRNISVEQFKKIYDSATIDRILARANWHPTSSADMDIVAPFGRYLVSVCGLSQTMYTAVISFLIWAASMHYIRDIPAFLASEEAQEIAGPICVKFAEVLSRDGKRQSVSDSNTDTIHDWCEDLEKALR